MKHYLILFVVFICCSVAAFAQNPNLKWGKPSQTEWSLQAWGEAPDAEAVVLCKTLDVNYKITRQFSSYSETNTELSLASIEYLGSNDNNLVTMTYDNKLRIKILKDTGAGFANVDIVYYNEENDLQVFDALESLKVSVFSQNEKGKVSRRNVKKESFTEERLNPHYLVLHVKVPDVKKGDIIEYQYTVTSSRITYLYDCSFQEDIPVMYAKCDMDIPAFLQFNMKVPVHPFIKSKVERSVVRAEQGLGDMQAPKSFPSNHYVIEGHDILPKGLDLQRNDPNVEGAKVTTTSGQIMKTVAVLKNPGNAVPAAMPEGKNHLMINVK